MLLKPFYLWVMILIGTCVYGDLHAAAADRWHEKPSEEEMQAIAQFKTTESAQDRREWVESFFDTKKAGYYPVSVPYAALQAIITSTWDSSEKTHLMDCLVKVSGYNFKGLLDGWACEGKNILGLACKTHDLSVVRWCVSNGCEVTAKHRDNGEDTALSPFHCLFSGAKAGPTEESKLSFYENIGGIIDLLSSKGANVNTILTHSASASRVGGSTTPLDQAQEFFNLRLFDKGEKDPHSLLVIDQLIGIGAMFFSELDTRRKEMFAQKKTIPVSTLLV